MSEPRRLLEEDSSSEVELALLRVGTSYRCSNRQREKVLATLGLVGAAGFGTAATTFSFRHLFDTGPVPWIAGLSAVGLAAAVPVSIMLSRPSHTELAMPKVMTALAAVAIPAAMSTATADAHKADAGLLAGDQSGPREVATGASGRTRPIPLGAVPIPLGAVPVPLGAVQRKAEGLTEELRALDEVRRLLSSGQANTALVRLDTYSREYPAGRLGLEAEVLRIDALAQSGRSAAAEQRAEAFLRQYPKSVLASRVRRQLRR